MSLLRGCTTAVVVALVLSLPMSAFAQTALIPGGLVSLQPVYGYSPNLVQNPGFEALGASWISDGWWGADQLVSHSGQYSFRLSNAPTAPYVESARQNIQLTKGLYRMSGWIKTDSLGTNIPGSGVRLTLHYSTGGVQQWAPTTVVRGTTDWTYYELVNIVIPEDLTATMTLEAYSAPSGTAWFDDVRVEQQLPAPLDVFLLYPNYRGMLFDDKPQDITLDVTVTPPTGAMTDYDVVAVLAEEATGHVVDTDSSPAAPQLTMTLDGSVMRIGIAYTAKVQLVSHASGTPVFAYPAYRLSKVPGTQRATMNIAFDEKNHILVRGVPRFLLGVYDSDLDYSTVDSFWENALWSETGSRRMNGLRINFYLNYWFGAASAAAMDSLMANLQKHGVMYLQTGNCFAGYPLNPAFRIQSSDDYVRDLGSQAGSAGYYTADECDSTLVPSIFAQYQRLKTLDPDSMTFMANLPSRQLYLWRDAGDLLGTDPYPMYGAEPAGGYPHYRVANGTDLVRNAVKNARPFVTVLQFFQFTSRGRWPTLQEMRTHAYMAIVGGAKGLWWWSLGENALYSVCPSWCDERTGYMNNLKALVSELADLEPVLLADDADAYLVSNSNAAAIRTKVKFVAGKGYIFAYNYTNSSISTTLKWHTPLRSVTVSTEHRTIKPVGASFSDTFGPYAAHVYVLDSRPSTGGSPPPPSSGPATVSFASPTNGSAVKETVNVSAAASGVVSSIGLSLDQASVMVVRGPSAAYTWNTTKVGNGPHSWKATAYDAAGNSIATSAVTTIVNNPDTTAPVIAITQPLSAMVARKSRVTLAAAASDNVGVVKVEFYVNGTLRCTDTAAPYTCAWRVPAAAGKSYVLQAKAYDAAGNIAVSSSVTVVGQHWAPRYSGSDPDLPSGSR